MNQQEIDHQLDLLQIHRNNAQHYVVQQAKGNTLPIVINGLLEARSNIARIKMLLANNGIHIQDMPGIDTPLIEMVTIQMPRETYELLKYIVTESGYDIELPEV